MEMEEKHSSQLPAILILDLVVAFYHFTLVIRTLYVFLWITNRSLHERQLLSPWSLVHAVSVMGRTRHVNLDWPDFMARVSAREGINRQFTEPRLQPCPYLLP